MFSFVYVLVYYFGNLFFIFMFMCVFTDYTVGWYFVVRIEFMYIVLSLVCVYMISEDFQKI